MSDQVRNRSSSIGRVLSSVGEIPLRAVGGERSLGSPERSRVGDDGGLERSRCATTHLAALLLDMGAPEGSDHGA